MWCVVLDVCAGAASHGGVCVCMSVCQEVVAHRSVANPTTRASLLQKDITSGRMLVCFDRVLGCSPPPHPPPIADTQSPWFPSLPQEYPAAVFSVTRYNARDEKSFYHRQYVAPARRVPGLCA